MNKVFILIASVAAVTLVSCKDPVDVPGDQELADVLLQVRISPENATKTTYSGQGESSGAVLVRERIDWNAGDMIRIASDEAHYRRDVTQHWADYKVKTYVDASLNSQAAISPATGSGLVWNKNVTNHNFYGMYPSPSVFGGNANVSLDPLDATNSSMHAFIPAEQYLRARGTTGADARYFLPSDSSLDTTMRYAWMFSPVTTGTQSSGNLKMDFHPVFTAFEFVLDTQVDLTVTSATLTSESRALNGNFAVRTSETFTGDWYPGTGANGDWYPSAGAATGGATANYPVNANFPEVTASTAAQRSVTATLPGSGVTLTPGNPISVTLLALPQAHKGLTISFETSEGTRKLALKLADKTTWIAWRGCRKYRISGLTIPIVEELTLEANDLILWDNLDIIVVDTYGWGDGLDVVFGDNMVFRQY